MASERRTEAKAKAATGPPVIAERYEVPVEAVFVKRWRTEVVTRDMLVFPYGEGFFYSRKIHGLQEDMFLQYLMPRTVFAQYKVAGVLCMPYFRYNI